LLVINFFDKIVLLLLAKLALKMPLTAAVALLALACLVDKDTNISGNNIRIAHHYKQSKNVI
jgi:hypothetical protein